MLGLIDHALGWKRVSDLAVADCDDFLAAAADGLRPGARKIGPDHLRRVRSKLVAVIDNEVRLGTVGRNVAAQSYRPKQVPRRRRAARRRALSRDELRRFIAASSGATLVAVDLIGRNGLRPAEARGLTWDAVDLVAQVMLVETQMDSDDDPADVKTDESFRRIRIDSTTAARLTEWRSQQSVLRARHASRWTERCLVVSTRYGTAINRNNFVRSVARLSAHADIGDPIVPYELRHTAISHQADAGRSSWEIADWAGTSERMISDTYRHQLRDISDLTPADEVDRDGPPRG
ncbi:MAG: tyrosine-type recombinase/integrase [Actinomycetota bacterium]